MPTSRLFESNRFKSLESAIVKLLNSEPYFLTTATQGSTRAAGDAIQSILADRLGELLGDLVKDTLLPSRGEQWLTSPSVTLMAISMWWM